MQSVVAEGATDPTDEAPHKGLGVSIWELAAAVGIAATAMAFYVINSADLWFFGDDWAFLVRRRSWWIQGQTFDFFFHPHNEHLSILPVLFFEAAARLFGIDTPLPWFVLLYTIHVAVSLLVYLILIRLGVDRWLRLLGAAWIAFLGSGGENLVWPFQIGFLLALLFGLTQVLLIDHFGPVGKRDVLGATAAIGALMTAGVGLTTLAVTAVLLGWRRRWFALLVNVGVPGLLYATWFIPYGNERRPDYGENDVSVVLPYARRGLENALERVTQLPLLGLGIGILAVGLVLVAPQVQRRQRELVFSLAVGAAVFFILGGYGRSPLGPEQSTASRYVYIVGPLLVPLLLVAAQEVINRQRLLRPLVYGLVLVAVIGNVSTYFTAREDRLAVLAQVRPAIEGAALFSDSPFLSPSLRPDPVFTPDIDVQGLRRLLDEGRWKGPQGWSDQELLEAASVYGLVVNPDDYPESVVMGPILVLGDFGEVVGPIDGQCVDVQPSDAPARLSLQPGARGLMQTYASGPIELEFTSSSRSPSAVGVVRELEAGEWTLGLWMSSDIEVELTSLASFSVCAVG